ncbi:MAG: DUF3658 domain-containing protein [Flavonifractor plautii]
MVGAAGRRGGALGPGLGRVHPEEFGLHLGGAEELTRPVLRMLALEWERLREENAPLRAVVNGRVMGVSGGLL